MNRVRELDLVALKEVFGFGHFFGDNTPSDIEQLWKMLREGEVVVLEFTMPEIPDNRWNGRTLIKKNCDEELPVALFTGGFGHELVCARSALWLESQGLSWSDSDLDYAGGIADVMASDRSIAVEAGYTQSIKVIRAISASQSVLVVPYARELTGFLFLPGHASMATTGRYLHAKPKDSAGLYLKGFEKEDS